MIWTKCSDAMPDDEITVLLALADGEVWTGYSDGERWRYESGVTIELPVTHWMGFTRATSAEIVSKCIKKHKKIR
jgi:hypothetical protein